jgi:hypothetical protein
MMASENYGNHELRTKALELAVATQKPHETSDQIVTRADAFRVFLTQKDEASNG